jgi:hypothetical protein
MSACLSFVMCCPVYVEALQRADTPQRSLNERTKKIQTVGRKLLELSDQILRDDRRTCSTMRDMCSNQKNRRKEIIWKT